MPAAERRIPNSSKGEEDVAFFWGVETVRDLDLENKLGIFHASVVEMSSSEKDKCYRAGGVIQKVYGK